MINRRFHSRRVWILHGLLLVAVLVVTWVSARAQYRSLRDQELEELRIQQQNVVRTTALLIEQNIRLLSVAMPQFDVRSTADDAVPRAWLRDVATLNRVTGQIITDSLPSGDDTIGQRVRDRHPDLLKARQPMLRLDGAEFFLATPVARQPSMVRVALLSGEQIASELLSIKSRTLDATVYLGMDSGPMLSMNGSVSTRQLLDVANDSDLYKQIRSLIEAGSVGTPIAQLPEPRGLSMITVQPMQPLPGVKWFLLVERTRLEEVIDGTLRPLVWQLVSWAGAMVLAVMVVLLSTTISLYRGRRRIERLRMDMLNRDLQKARTIQLNWLPAPQRKTDDYEVAAINEPAAHISGDFYNWFDLPITDDTPTRRTAIVIGDVSGHGLSAAFLMSTTQLLVKASLPVSCDAGACLTELNRQLCLMSYQGQFVTILIMIVDFDAGTLSIASAGQSPPLLRRGDQCQPLDLEPQLVVGVDDATVYESHTFNFLSGDLLVLYTDGVVETTNDAAKQFGESGLVDAVLNVPADNAQRALHSILGAIAAHRQGGDPDDDLTLVALRVVCSRFGSAHHSPPEAAMV